MKSNIKELLKESPKIKTRNILIRQRLKKQNSIEKAENDVIVKKYKDD